MPTYDYRCPNGHDFELFFRKISDAGSAVPCPQCGAEAVRRVSGGAGLVFKGSGFYLTDYGKNAHRKAGAASSSGEGKSDGKSDGKSEGKSEGGSDGKTETKPDSSKPEGGTAAPAASGEGATRSAKKSEGSKASESKPSSTKSKSGDGQ